MSGDVFKELNFIQAAAGLSVINRNYEIYIYILIINQGKLELYDQTLLKKQYLLATHVFYRFLPITGCFSSLGISI